jgi:sulfite exporter TauE/SafE
MGVVPRPLWSRAATIGPACLMGTFAKPFLTSPHGLHILLAGVFTGFLPCGLVYGYLTLAASASNIRDGLLTMAFFGAGTTPLLILTGTGASLISHAARRRLLRISAACVALTGLISIARGVLFFHFIPAPETVRCLLCGQLR